MLRTHRHSSDYVEVFINYVVIYINCVMIYINYVVIYKNCVTIYTKKDWLVFVESGFFLMR